MEAQKLESVSMSYRLDERRDALAFDILQNMEPKIAQSFFWNFKSRTERREAILAWKADQEMNESAARQRGEWRF